MSETIPETIPAVPSAIPPVIPLPAFGDAADAASIPASHACLYSPDCDFPCPPDLAARWPKDQRHWITFAGARQCSIADYEPHTEVYYDPAGLRRWIQVRQHQEPALGRRSIIYCNRSDAAKALAAIDDLPVLWWIATLDGVQRTRQQLADELARDWHAPIAPALLWAQQWVDHGSWDQSFLYGTW